MRKLFLFGYLFLFTSIFSVLVSCQSSGLNHEGDKYKAVFLTNGQVYYGKLVNDKGQFYTFEDIYYIWRNPNPQEGQGPELTLIKMGNEIHGPEEVIKVNREHILLIEDLREDGQVVQKIHEAKNKAEKEGDQPKQKPPMIPTQGGSPQLSPNEIEEFKKFQEFQKIKNQQDQVTSDPSKPIDQP